MVHCHPFFCSVYVAAWLFAVCALYCLVLCLGVCIAPPALLCAWAGSDCMQLSCCPWLALLPFGFERGHSRWFREVPSGEPLTTLLFGVWVLYLM
jgi:hypothetical protein